MEKTKPVKKKRALAPGTPYIASGVVFFILCFILPVYRLGGLVFAFLFTLPVYYIYKARYKRYLSKLPQPKAPKDRADEMAAKIQKASFDLGEKAELVDDENVKATIKSISSTMDKIAEDIETDPSDRDKARRLANYYGDMMVELVDKYINLQLTEADVNSVNTSMLTIRQGLESADVALKKLLDDLFADDNMMVTADIETLETLLRKE